MKIINTDSNKATAQFNKDEFRTLGNTLNEILNAFSWDLSGTGWTTAKARQLHDYIRANYKPTDDNQVICSFTKQEITFLIQAINKTIEELDWEYATRLGFTIEEARQLQASLQGASQTLVS